MAYVIFDLDHTVICSKHRHSTLPCGSLDLAHWRENSTAEMIAKDGLLPLANAMRAIYAVGHTVVICTARVMSEHDVAFLDTHGLKYHALLSRDGENDNRRDAQLKIDLLRDYFEREGTTIFQARPIMFDDNLSVIDAVRREGVICIDATKENARYARRV
jgi:hypothetical protein